MAMQVTITNARVLKPKDGSPAVQVKTSQQGKQYALFTAMVSDSRRNQQTGETEYGPAKFVHVRVFGFKAQQVAENLQGDERVMLNGILEYFTWESQQGPKDDWKMLANAVAIEFPRAQGGQQQPGYQQQGQQQAQQPWGQPQGGFGAGEAEQPPF